MQPIRDHLHRLTYLAVLSFALTVAVQAQATAPAPLPPEAQAAIKKGIIAAKEQEWMIAIQSFQEARKTAPNSPEVFYNLGLAESKLPGRELRAIAWFGAYVNASPNAPNAAAVNDFIAGLQIKSRGNLNRLIKTAQDSEGKISEDGFSRAMDLSYVAGLWAKAGDMTAAMKTIAFIDDDERNKDKTFGYEYIAVGQAEAGDIPGALGTANLIENGISKCEALRAIAVEQIKAGDAVGAENTFASAVKTADHIQDPLVQRHNREDALNDLATVQAGVGYIAGALKTLNLIRDANLQGFNARRAIINAQVSAGDIADAQDIVNRISDPTQRKLAQGQLDARIGLSIVIRARLRPVVADWLVKLDEDDRYISFKSQMDIGPRADYCSLNTDIFLDLAGYLKSLQRSDDPHKLFYALYNTASKIAGAQIVIDQMLKQQAPRSESRPSP
jgi:tetratricopeptide (TPR) repeat protein